MNACCQCGREVGPLRTEAGLYRRGTDISLMDPKGLFCTMRCAARYGVAKAEKARETQMNRQDFPAGPLGDRAWEIAQHNGGYGLQALADAVEEADRREPCRQRLFVAKHREFTLTPRLCRWSGRGWSLWWLWFELAKIGGEA